MTNETKAFLNLGYWNRQKELLDEAHRLHRANKAVREAKRAALHASTRVQVEAGTPAMLTAVGDRAQARRTPRRAGLAPGAARKPVPAWRTAAARMGSSLVAVGERLERLALRGAGPS